MDEDRLQGRPLARDETAASADPDLPAFLARPAGAPAYHGFPLLEEVELGGWQLGLITASLGTSDDAGDAYIVAPDGRRAGLVWRVATPTAFHVLREPEQGRFGVFDVAATVGPTSLDNARSFVAEILPFVRDVWSRTQRYRPARSL
jgi:hypothetical protein